jgi:hypothetical protein
LKAAGAVRLALSILRTTSAVLRAGRLLVPAKITSSIPDARMFLYELSPIAQRRASTRFDLPQPFGPMMPVRPGSIRMSAGSTKDLKPTMRRPVSFIAAPPPSRADRPDQTPSIGLTIFSMSSIDRAPG